MDDDSISADTLFEILMAAVPWRAERRQMYDRLVDVPRLVSFCDLTTDEPVGGGSSLRLPQSHGDLMVTGGSCQRTWEHAVPKTSAPTGPRISIQFRPRGVR